MSRAASSPDPDPQELRGAPRTPVYLPGRMTWQDAGGTDHTVRVRTRDVSAVGVYVECLDSTEEIPRYRLVELRLDSAVRLRDDIPGPLRQPRIPAAVYRHGDPDPHSGRPTGFGLRLLIKPERRTRVSGPTRL